MNQQSRNEMIKSRSRRKTSPIKSIIVLLLVVHIAFDFLDIALEQLDRPELLPLRRNQAFIVTTNHTSNKRTDNNPIERPSRTWIFTKVSRLRLKPLEQVAAISLVRLEAPSSVHANQSIRLRCLYETKDDKLQSLSWYKNGREFFRYQPFERRHSVLAFKVAGVNVDMMRSRNNTVVLTNTTTETTGRYKCEATGTSFQEVNMETYVSVTPVTSNMAASFRTKTRGVLQRLLTCSTIIVVMLNLISFLPHYTSTNDKYS